MVPDRDSTSVELGAPYGRVELRYPLGALRRAARALGKDDGLTKLHELLLDVTHDNVATFVWAGMLHHPAFVDLPLEQLKEHVEWRVVPWGFLIPKVNGAMNMSIVGELDPSHVEPERGKAESPGAGRVRRGSLVRRWVYRLNPFGGISRRPASGHTQQVTQTSSSGGATNQVHLSFR